MRYSCDSVFWLVHCFFNDTATTEIYTLSLHDALPISRALEFLDRLELSATERLIGERVIREIRERLTFLDNVGVGYLQLDRKSTRLNSSHANISYAVFCLKKKQD